MRVGDVDWVTVSAWQPGGASVAGESESSVQNDSSVVGIAEISGLRILLPGDAEPGGQEQAIRRARKLGIPLSAHVLKIPHHGSSRQEPEFLEASSAQLAVASCGLGNDEPQDLEQGDLAGHGGGTHRHGGQHRGLLG